MIEDRSVSEATGAIGQMRLRDSDGHWNVRSLKPKKELLPLGSESVYCYAGKTRGPALRPYLFFSKISNSSERTLGPLLVRTGWMLWLSGSNLTMFLIFRMKQTLEALCTLRVSQSVETWNSVLARLFSHATFSTHGALYVSSLSIGGIVMTALGALLIKVGRDASPDRHPKARPQGNIEVTDLEIEPAKMQTPHRLTKWNLVRNQEP